jgi:hypothetical protein
MRLLSGRPRYWKSLLGAAVLGLTATAAQAQPPAAPPLVQPPSAAPSAAPPAAAPAAPVPTYSPCAPCPGLVPAPGAIPGYPTIPGALPGAGAGMEGGAGAGAGAAPAAEEGAFRAVTSGAGFGSSTAVGYIDSAIPITQLRLRYDDAYRDNRPDRAEFFYPKCGCFATLPPGNPLRDPSAPGPPLTERSVDFQELRTCLEYAPVDRFSAFVEIPVRWINPEVNANASGLGDVDFGAKYAFLMDPCRVATFQLRTFTPSGDGFRGLGTDHWSLEPALLYYRKLGPRAVLEGEFRDFIPLDGTDFAGNVLRYGVGLSYQAYRGPRGYVAPVVEFVGWTVLDGKESNEAGTIKSAGGDTIVNVKLGARIGFGDLDAPGVRNHSDLYVGYGRALTGDVWYKDILRVELRLRF